MSPRLLIKKLMNPVESKAKLEKFVLIGGPERKAMSDNGQGYRPTIATSA
jgi:hypothetical protein